MLPFAPQTLHRPIGNASMARHHKIVLGRNTFEPHLSGALFAPDFKTLLVADLHLEQGASLARRGVHIPPFDTAHTLSLLEQVISETKPWRIVLMGDSFHDSNAASLLAPEERLRLHKITSEIETIWLSGNHDPEPVPFLGGVNLLSHVLDDIKLLHIPSRHPTGLEIAGHLHPGATLIQRGIATRAKCFIADHRRIIMPAFGSYTGALSVRSKAFEGLVDIETSYVWMMRRSSIHKFPLTRVAV